jgi:hypothetical protein
MSIPPNNYLRTREVALRMGIDAIGMPTAAGGGLRAATYGELLEGLFGAPRSTTEVPPAVQVLSNM